MLSVWDTAVSHDAAMGAILAKGMSVHSGPGVGKGQGKRLYLPLIGVTRTPHP